MTSADKKDLDRINITGSFGVASLRAGSEETVDLITGRADDTMYRAKREGRNRVCMASES